MADVQTVDLWALSDLCTPWCVHVVSTLRIAELLQQEPRDVAHLATEAQCDPGVLRGILRHLVGKGVFLEPSPGTFALNEAARGLLDPGLRLGLDLEGLGGRMAHTWSTMLKYARTGQPAYADIFGRGFWEDLDAHPALAEQFDELMGLTGHGTPNAEFDIAGGWDSVRSVVDVGGGTGAMLTELLRLHPHLRGTLVDRPRAVARAEANDRVSVSGQSFFDPLPAGADLYLLRKVLNDLPDAEAQSLLRRCAEAAGPAGRVLILKSADRESGGHGILIEQILVGGKHRSVDEVRLLGQECGLELVSAGPQPAGFIVELRVK